MAMWQNWVEVKRNKHFIKRRERISPGSKREGNKRINLKDGGQRVSRQRVSKKNTLVQFCFDELLQVGIRVSF